MAIEAGDLSTDTEAMKTPRRKRLAERWADGGFLAAWQRDRMPTTERAKELDDEEDDDDDDSPESAAKPFARGKRAGSLLLGIKSLFRREPAKSEAPKEVDETPKAEVVPKEPPAGDAEAIPVDIEADPVDVESASDEVVEIEESEEPEAAETIHTEPVAEETVDTVEDEEDEDDDAATTPATATGGAGGSSRGGGSGRRPSGGTTPPRRPVPVPPTSSAGFGGDPGPGSGLALDRAPTVVTERVIVDPGRERLAALALIATGAEHFGRRRADKRQERQFDRKLETAKQENRAETAALQTQAEQLARRQKEEARQAKERELVFERRLRDQQKQTEKVTTMRAERIATVPEKRVENQPQDAAEIRLKPESQVESTTVYERIHDTPQTDIIEQRTETIANQPKEMLYEQRHEIKDDQAFYANTNQQDDLAKLQALQQANARQLVDLRGMQYQQKDDQKLADKQAQTADPAIYKQAMLMGLVGAGLIVILGLLAYFILR